MNKVLFGIAIALVLCGNVFGGDNVNSALFVSGNRYYAVMNYDSAVDCYERLIKNGVDDYKVYYNLGNCYYRKGNIGKAMLNYGRAKKLSPRDEDVNANIELVRSIVTANVLFPDKGVWITVFENAYDYATVDETVLFTSVLFFVSLILTALWINMKGVLKKFLKFISFVFVVLFALTFLFSFWKVYDINNYRDGVIMEKANLRSGPSEEEKATIIIPEGIEASVTGEEDNWLKVKLKSGGVGWVKSSCLKLI